MPRSITGSIVPGHRLTRCWSSFSWRRMSVRRARSCSISTIPTFRCTALRKAGSSMVIMTHTATCRSTCSAAGICCWPGSDGAIEEMTRIIGQIRQTWPRVRIILRGDSGFANEPLMRWCEEHRVDYVFGLARNSRLEAALGKQGAEPRRLCLASGKPAWVFRDFRYRTRDSWCRKRRVVGKAEHTPDGANPRFVVTSLKHARIADPRALYEDLYCARGEAENRIGEQFELFADRASSATMMANQLRMWFSAMAYVLVDTLRRVGLHFTQFADASAQTIRLKLLKLGAQVRTSVRRIHFAMASGCPNKIEFELAYIYLQRAFSSA